MPPTNGADTGNEPEPIYEQNEDEDRRKKPKCFPNQIAADDVFEKIVKAFDEPFPKILCSRRHRFDVARGGLGKDNHSSRDDPGNEHRVRQDKFAEMKNLSRF